MRIDPFANRAIEIRALVFGGFLLVAAAAPLFGQMAPLSSFEGISVTPVDRNDTSRLVDAGVVSVEGAGGFVVTLAGELRGRADKDGVIGVILVPELPFFSGLYRSRKLILSAAEFTAPVSSGSSSDFMAPSKHAPSGFRRTIFSCSTRRALRRPSTSMSTRRETEGRMKKDDLPEVPFQGLNP